MQNILTYDQPHGFHQPAESVSGNVSVVIALGSDLYANKCHESDM